MRRRRFIAALLAGLAVAGVVGGCGAGGSSSSTQSESSVRRAELQAELREWKSNAFGDKQVVEASVRAGDPKSARQSESFVLHDLQEVQRVKTSLAALEAGEQAG